MNDQGNQSDFQTRYSHADALGSVDLITDGVGDIVDKMNFDPFGKRRTAYWRTSQDSSLALHHCSPIAALPAMSMLMHWILST